MGLPKSQDPKTGDVLGWSEVMCDVPLELDGRVSSVSSRGKDRSDE